MTISVVLSVTMLIVYLLILSLIVNGNFSATSSDTEYPSSLHVSGMSDSMEDMKNNVEIMDSEPFDNGTIPNPNLPNNYDDGGDE